MTLIAICCAVLAVWAAGGPAQPAARLGRSPRRRSTSPGLGFGPLTSRPSSRRVICVAASSVVGWLAFGWLGVAIGIPSGLLLAAWVSGLETPERARMRREIARDLPLAADLLAACVSAGRTTEGSLPLVGGAVGGALGERLNLIGARLALGADPHQVWADCAADPQLAGLGRVMARSVRSGAPLADGLSRLADDQRRERRTEAQKRARTVGVRAAGPLGLCFLPAFMVIGVVPTVAGSVQHLFG